MVYDGLGLYREYIPNTRCSNVRKVFILFSTPNCLVVNVGRLGIESS